MKIEAETIGFENILKGLANLEPKVRNRLVKQALNPAAELIRATIVKNAPKDTGALKTSVSKSKVKFRRGLMEVFIGTWSGMKEGGYVFQVETGHYIGKRPGSVKTKYRTDSNGNKIKITTGETRKTYIQPNPFIRKSFDAQSRNFWVMVGESLQEGLVEALGY